MITFLIMKRIVTVEDAQSNACARQRERDDSSFGIPASVVHVATVRLDVGQHTLREHLHYQKYLRPATRLELPGWQKVKPGEWIPIISDKSESSLPHSDASSSATRLYRRARAARLRTGRIFRK